LDIWYYHEIHVMTSVDWDFSYQIFCVINEVIYIFLSCLMHIIVCGILQFII